MPRGVIIVVAHPDDETIGCGALLQHLTEACLVIVTDGAPRDLRDANAHGYATAESYAAARRQELAAALDAGGARHVTSRYLAIPDQQAAMHLVAICERLVNLLRQQDPVAILTHAYEGGHPDHDATAFCAHMAARIAGMRSRLFEMPFYRLVQEEMVVQSPAAVTDGSICLRLSEPERRLKRRMVAAHASQQAVLAAFAPETEHYLPAPNYDFAQLPNGGRLLYEQQNWGLTGVQWLQATRDALERLAPMAAA